MVAKNLGIYRRVKIINPSNQVESEYESCPRCDGTLASSGDHYGDYWACIDCGFYEDIAGEVELEQLKNLANLQKRILTKTGSG